MAAMAPKSKDKRLGLGEPWASELAAFRTAMGLGNTEIGVVRAAIRAFIKMQVGRDEDLRIAYEAELERINAAKIQPIRLVKTDNEGGPT